MEQVIIGARVNERQLANSAASALRAGAAAATPMHIKASFPTGDLKKMALPLGRITGDLNQFQGALDASVARVLAFGASASVLAGVASALRGIVEAGIEVEKSLADINSILKLSSSSLAEYGSKLFDVARNTATSFKETATAALELSRQGLNAEETIKRLNDALILARLTGMDTTTAVSSLTAAVNGFSKEGINSTEIINRLASVETRFAVSAKDLAEALSRAGAVSQDAGVQFNELISIVTAVQQQTARGGAVIGNGFKSIFTRIQRSEVRETLESIGVATSDSSGAFRGAIPILRDYARVYQGLSDTEKSSTAEKIAGVFQINTLKAALNDLNKEYSVYSGALGVANSATDEAQQRNEQLNKTTAALLTNTTTSLKEFGAALSDLAANEGLRNILTIVDTVAKKMADFLDEEKGSAIAKALIGGIGNFIAGPGLAIMGMALFKLLKFLTSEVAMAFKQIQNLNIGKQQQLKTEAAIGSVLVKNEDLLLKIAANEGNRLVQEELILGAIKQQEVALRQVQIIQKAIAGAAASGIYAVAPKGGVITKKSAASGYVPNFASPRIGASTSEKVMETMSAYHAGYKAGNVYNTRIHDGKGGSFISTVNGAEDITTVVGPNGQKGTFVTPPTAARGYIPNFVRPYNIGGTIVQGGQNVNRMLKDAITRGDKKMIADIEKSGYKTAEQRNLEKTQKKSSLIAGGGLVRINAANQLGIGALVGIGASGPKQTAIQVSSLENKSIQKNLQALGMPSSGRIQFNNLPVSSFMEATSRNWGDVEGDFSSRIDKYFLPALKGFSQYVFSSILGDDAGRIVNAIGSSNPSSILPKGAQGAIFESAIKLANKNARYLTTDTTEQARWDFEEAGGMNKRLKKIFFNRYPITRADAKRSDESRNIQSLIGKALGTPDMFERIAAQIKNQSAIASKKGGKALGYVPNFAQLGTFRNPTNRNAMMVSGNKLLQQKSNEFKAKIAIGASDPELQTMMQAMLSIIRQDGVVDSQEVKVWMDALNILKKHGRDYVARKFPKLIPTTRGFGSSVLGGIKGIFKAEGFAPSGALGEAVGREAAAGIPTSAIRINKSAKLRNSRNPAGLAVTNTIDEPRGLSDVFANGYVPNFANVAYNPIGGERLTTALLKLAENVSLSSYQFRLLRAQTDGIVASFRRGDISATEMAKQLRSATMAVGANDKVIKQFTRTVMNADRATMSKGALAGGSGWNKFKTSLGAEGSIGKHAARIQGIGMFAGFTAAAAMEQREGKVGDIGKGLSSGLQVAMIAGMINPVFGLIAGGVTGIMVAANQLLSNTKELQKELEKMKEKLNNVTQASGQYISKLEEYKSLVESGEGSEKLQKSRKELEESLYSIKDKSLQQALESAGTDVQKVEKIIANTIEIKKRDVGLKEIETSISELTDVAYNNNPILGGPQRYFQGSLGIGLDSKTVSEKTADILDDIYQLQKNQPISQEFKDAMAKYNTYGYKMLNAMDRAAINAIIPEKFLRDYRQAFQTQELANRLIEESYQKPEKDKTEKSILQRQSNLRNKSNELRSYLKNISEGLTENERKSAFGMSLFKDIFQGNRKSVIQEGVVGGYRSAYATDRIKSKIDAETAVLESEKKAKGLLGGFVSKLVSGKAGEGLLLAEQERKTKEYSSAYGGRTVAKNITIFEAKLRKDAEVLGGLLDSLGPDMRGGLKTRNGEVVGFEIEALKDAFAKYEAIQKDEKSTQKEKDAAKEANDLIKKLLDETVIQTDEMTKQRISMNIQKIQAERAENQASVARLSGGILDQSKIMGIKGKGPESFSAMRDALTQFSGTDSTFGDLAKFGMGQQDLITNLRNTFKTLGFGDMIQNSALVKERNNTLPYAERQTTVTEKLQSFINNAQAAFQKIQTQTNVSARNVAFGTAGQKDFQNLTTAAMMVTSERAAKTAIENQQRSGAVFARASKEWENQPKGKKSIVEAYDKAEMMVSNRETVRDLFRAGAMGGDTESISAALQQVFGDAGTREEVIRKVENATPAQMAELLSKLSTDSTDVAIKDFHSSFNTFLTLFRDYIGRPVETPEGQGAAGQTSIGLNMNVIAGEDTRWIDEAFKGLTEEVRTSYLSAKAEMGINPVPISPKKTPYMIPNKKYTPIFPLANAGK